MMLSDVKFPSPSPWRTRGAWNPNVAALPTPTNITVGVNDPVVTNDAFMISAPTAASVFAGIANASAIPGGGASVGDLLVFIGASNAVMATAADWIWIQGSLPYNGGADNPNYVQVVAQRHGSFIDN